MRCKNQNRKPEYVFVLKNNEVGSRVLMSDSELVTRDRECRGHNTKSTTVVVFFVVYYLLLSYYLRNLLDHLRETGLFTSRRVLFDDVGLYRLINRLVCF